MNTAVVKGRETESKKLKIPFVNCHPDLSFEHDLSVRLPSNVLRT